VGGGGREEGGGGGEGELEGHTKKKKQTYISKKFNTITKYLSKNSKKSQIFNYCQTSPNTMVFLNHHKFP